ncbi:MAG: 50S ribosomal protein L10 [Candidatus Izemoplasmatales bacterium]|jgi:large subunit ribosomal protein L10
MTSHTKKWKAEKLSLVKGLAKDYPFIAVATLESLPANIVSLIRKRLAGEAVVVVAKTRVVQRAFAESGVDTSKLDPYVKESVAIIFSKKNPFELFSFVKKNKGSAAAKDGDIADKEIIIQAGDTGLPPGPALATLKAVGLKVKVAGPTIEVAEDKVVVKKGEKVTAPVADVLSKLNIKPIKIGMKIIGVLDKNEKEFYSAEVLDVDEEELFEKFVSAYRNALNLAVNAEYFTNDTMEILVMKAQREATAIKSATDSAVPQVAEAPKEVEASQAAEVPKTEEAKPVEDSKPEEPSSEAPPAA